MSQDTVVVNPLTIAFIAMGGNATSPVGGPEKTLRAAISRLSSDSCEIFLKSRYFRTPAFPAGSGPDFVNAAIAVRTNLTPEALLKYLHGVEESFGRVRTERWAARTLDLDLLAYGDAVRPDPETQKSWRDLPLDEQMKRAPDELILPHPRLQERAFVLVPLADIAEGWRHPVLGKSVAEMLEGCPEVEKASIEPLETGF